MASVCTWIRRPSSQAVGAAGVLLALSAASSLGAQVSPRGPEFQVNSYTTSAQWFPSVAAGALGNFVVAWVSWGSDGTDTDVYSVQAQRYDANGAPQGEQFQVNTFTTGNQGPPSIAVDAQGNFVVVWESEGSSGTDDDLKSVQAQRYDSGGIVLGGEFQVNTLTTRFQDHSSVAVDALGNFVVVWRSYVSSGTDDLFSSIQAQRYAAAGTPLGGQFQVNSYSTGSQSHPSVAADAQGNFVVVWESVGSSGTDTDSYSIQAQRYASDGNPLGGQFQVNSYTTAWQGYPAIAADAQGNFVVAWMSQGSSGTDTGDLSIQAQRYAADGTPLGGQFQVNSYTTGDQFRLSVAVEALGNFVVVWESVGSSGTDTRDLSIQAQRYAANGIPLGGQFQVNTYTTAWQASPSVAADAQGNFVVVWESRGSSGTDDDFESIQAQRYASAFFYDGFESGDTSRWSMTVP